MHLDPESEQALRTYLETNAPEVIVAYLFGSFARGTARPDSDIDIAILTAEPPEPTLEGQPFLLEANLERLVDREVQVVNLHSAPIDLVHRVLRDGQLLLERDRSARIAYEVWARNEYFDMEPILRRYRKQEKNS